MLLADIKGDCHGAVETLGSAVELLCCPERWSAGELSSEARKDRKQNCNCIWSGK